MVQNGFYYLSQREFWACFFQYHNNKDLLFPGDKATRLSAFRNFVVTINFETSAYCNRKCAYCPVSVVGGREQRFMSEEVFEKILSDLREIDYRGIMAMSLFNEPFASRDIIDRVRRVKNVLPWTYITMNSNGDYFNRDIMEEVQAAGAREVFITLHTAPGEVYSDHRAKSKIEDFFKKLELDYEITQVIENHSISANAMYRGLLVLVGTRNWTADGCDRGGTVPELSVQNRDYPCASPFREIAIDIDGNFRRCCNMYVNSKALDNVLNTSILDFYFSDIMNHIRRSLVTWGTDKPHPCDTCNAYNGVIQQYSIKEWDRLLEKSKIKEALEQTDNRENCCYKEK